MVEYSSVHAKKLDRVFHALSDSTRRSLLEKLMNEECRITDLASQYELSLNAVSKHLKVLEKAELIHRNVKGRVHYCKTNSEKLKDVEVWMAPYKKLWADSLDNLNEYLQERKGE